MSVHPATVSMATTPSSPPVARRPPCCKTCGQPVKGHKGPSGSRCLAPESLRGSEGNSSLNASLVLEGGRTIVCLNCEHPLTPSHQCEEVFNLSQEEFLSEKDADKSDSDLSEESRGEYKTESDASDPAQTCLFCNLYNDNECPYCSAETQAKLKKLKAKQEL